MELSYASVIAKGFPKDPARVYLLQGSDDALKREALQRLTEPLLDPSYADFDREEIDVPASGGTEDDLSRRILASAAGVPLASARRVVVVTNVHRLSRGKTEDKNSEGQQEVLAAGLPKLGTLSCLVLIAGAPIYDAGKVKGSVVGLKLVNAVNKEGVLLLCDAAPTGDLKSRAQSLLKERGKTIDPEGLAILLARAASVASDRGGGGKSGDLHVLVNEMEKSIAHAGSRAKITRDDVLATGTQNAEENIFALLDAVGRRDAPRALAETDSLLNSGDKADGVAARTFVMLARHLRLLWGAKYLAENRLNGYTLKGGLPPEAQAVLSGEMVGLTLRQSFLLKSLQEQARGWSDETLRDGLARVLGSDLAMKGITPIKALGAGTATGDDAGTNLRLLVLDLCR